ncbi:MAG TPA: helix-turn-helix transcriptional regulator [Trebonia sp.]
MEQARADVRQASRGASGDDAAQFLRELRQLRDTAGLGQAELAARAHYPYDAIRAAEIGPGLPDLPVLSAYVRGCGGTTEEWEERWRSLTRTPSLPVSGARQSGSSEAASAGARISAASPAGDGPDPSIIIAALSRVAEEMASPNDDATPAGVPPVPDFPPAQPMPTAPAPPQPPAGPGSGWGAGAGWDPIRVSSAWPVLQDVPAATAGSATGTGTADAAAPWEAAPWAENPLEPTGASDQTADPGTPGSAARAAAATAARTPRGDAAALTAAWSSPGARPVGRTQARASGRSSARSRARGSVNSSRTTLVVLGVVVLCVLAVLLAIFA